ncbi:MAG TPA: hypothetical protein PKJ72_10175 [Deltaproteobacteria bacterium]|nr:hypothetical protein [Deltaproteobacteria bacterium]HPH49638.1 hypothetical protein [Deltaproteobacteria bacterium]
MIKNGSKNMAERAEPGTGGIVIPDFIKTGFGKLSKVLEPLLPRTVNRGARGSIRSGNTGYYR